MSWVHYSPALVGVLAVRSMLGTLGRTELGIFSLALGVGGLTTLLDLGIGRGLTRLVALASEKKADNVNAAVSAGLVLLFVIGLFAGLAFFMLAPFVARYVKADPTALADAVVGFRWIGASIPFSLLAAGVLAVLEGHHEFGKTNLVRVPVGILTYLAPAVVSVQTGNVAWAMMALSAARALALPLSVATLLRVHRLHNPGFRGAPFRELIRFSGWLTVSYLVAPIIAFGDRFYLAVVMTTATLAYYTVPFDAVFRLMALPSAGLNALFPALASSNGESLSRSNLVLVARDVYFDAFWFVPLASLALLSHSVLLLWLDADFANRADAILSTIAIGIFINGYSQLPLAILHAQGKTDVVAKIHVAELPIYTVILVFAVAMFGLLGAAIAWTLRAAIDFYALSWTANCAEGSSSRYLMRVAAPCLLAAAATACTCAYAPPTLRLLIAGTLAVSAAIQAVHYIPCSRLFSPRQGFNSMTDVMSAWPADGLQSVGQCPACGGIPRKLMYADAKDVVFQSAPGTWQMFECLTCGSAYLDPRPTQQSIGLAYRGYYTHEMTEPAIVRRLGRVRRWLHDSMNGYANARYGVGLAPANRIGSWIVRIIPPLKSAVDAYWRQLPNIRNGVKTVLDIGCGNGGFLARVAQAGWSVFGVEPDDEAVERCRAKGLNVVVGGVEKLAKFSTGTFDWVTLSHVIEHVHDPRTLLQEALRILKPGGILWLETPNIQSEGHRKYEVYWRGLEVPRHLVIFNRLSLRQLLEQCGFTAIRWRGHGLVAPATFAASEAARAGEKGTSGSRDGKPRFGDLFAEIASIFQPRRHEYLTVTAAKPMSKIE